MKKYLKYLAIGSLFFAIGFFISRFTLDPVQASWDRVNNYKEVIANPDNWKKNGAFMDIEIPDTYSADLAVLVSANEIKHKRVFIPEVPNTEEYIAIWMSEISNDILEISSISTLQNGEIPLFFEIWYKPSYETKLSSLIERIKSKHRTYTEKPTQAPVRDTDERSN